LTRSDFEGWLDGYRQAWRTDDPQQIEALFTEVATYAPWPFGEPWRGRQDILAKWIDRGDSKAASRFESELLAVDGETGSCAA
jgi:hypothetical protein